MPDYLAERPSAELDRKASTGIFAWFANHRTAPNLMMIVLVLVGFWAANRMPVQIWPEIVINYLFVETSWPGASVNDVDELYHKTVLADLVALDGAKEVNGNAYNGFSFIWLELNLDADPEALKADVRAIVDAADLPKEAEQPIVRTPPFRPDVARIMLSGPLSQSGLVDVAQSLRSGLLDAGITAVNVEGLENPIIEVIPNEAKLRQLNLTIQNIKDLMTARSTDVTLGSLRGDILIQSLGRASSVQDINDLPLLTRSDGSTILLGDVAEVKETFPEWGGVRRKGNQAIELVVARRTGESSLKVEDILEGYVAGATGQPKPQTGLVSLAGVELQIPFLRNMTLENAWERGRANLLPAEIGVETFGSSAQYARERINLLVNNGVLGLAVVLVLLAVFLNLRTAFWVAVGIPVSVAATLGIMSISGQTIDMLSTFGLLLTLGIIVDDAIVVGEHADALAQGGYRLRPKAKSQLLVRFGTVLFTMCLIILGLFVVLGVIPDAKLIGADAGPLGMVGTLAGLIKNNLSPFLLIAASGCIVAAILVGRLLVKSTIPDMSYALKPRTAAVLAIERMAGPVSAAAISTCVAFAALLLLGGDFRYAMAIPLAVMAVVVASLLECFLILPGHMRHALEARAKERPHFLSTPLRWFRLGFDTLFDGFRFGIFRKTVRFLVFLRYPLVGLSIILFVWSISQVASGRLPFDLSSGEPINTYLALNYELIEGATREQNYAVIDEIQLAVIDAVEATNVDMDFDDAIEMNHGVVGWQSEQGGVRAPNNVNPDTIGSVHIILSEEYTGRLGQQQNDLEPVELLKRNIKSALPPNPLLLNFAGQVQSVGNFGPAVDIRILNADPATLKAAAEALKTALMSIDGVEDASDDMPYGQTKLALTLTDRGRALGLGETDLADQVRLALIDNDIFTFSDNGRDISVVVRFPETDRNRNFLEGLNLSTPTNGFVALSDVVDITRSLEFDQISRSGGLRQISVNASIADDSPNTDRDVVAILQDRIMPEIRDRFGVELRLSGNFATQQELQTNAIIAAVVALGGMYTLLALVFRSFSRPVVVMLIIPLGFVGLVWGHMLHGVPLGVLSLFGLFGLSGIIVNDSIVLASTMDRRRKIQPIWDAAVDSSVDRLRAVLLTSATTIGGLLPLIFSTSVHVAPLIQTVLAIVYGLAVGTFWVLFLVPALVTIQADIARVTGSFARMVSLALQGGRKGFTRNSAQ